MPVYCRKCRQEVPDLLSTETSTQCPNCGAPISFKDGIPRTAARLLLKDGEETVGEFRVSGPVSIGKDKANYVQILHPTVALKHAEILPQAGGHVIKDLGSEKGTFINGKRVTEAPLKDGDEIKVGDTRFLFLHPQEAMLPGQDFAISYTRAQQDLDKVAASLSPENLAMTPGKTLTGEPAAVSTELVRLTKLYEIGRDLASAADLALVMERIMDATFENLEPSRAAILMKHPSTGELYTTVARTRKAGKERARIPISRTVVNATMTKKEAVLIADSGALKVGAENTLVRHGIRSALCVPFMFKGQPLGSIYADCLDLTKQFNEADLRFLAGIAGMAAAAIVNARLMAKVNQERELRVKLEQRVSDEGWSTGFAKLEAREVTVLALRLVGTAPLMESGQPEKVATLLQELLGILCDRIVATEGTIAGATGSTILAVWGLTRPRETDALSALRTAFDLRGMFVQLNASRATRNLRPIWMSFGLAAGKVLAGPMAFRGRQEPGLLGGPADGAFLLASQAKQNQILVASTVQAKLAAHLEATPADPVTVGTGDDPVQAFVAVNLR
ncbi:MAG: FHA domain-containing protein [Candidatus Riflebacteria bacterium]|nr:FHA domain-containing protein [Candidatus Riflebacteria bacterium]